jgi:hypothetical protein
VIKICEREVPRAGIDGPKEAREKTLEDVRFVVVGGARNPIHNKSGDGVAAHAAGGGGVEKFCILVTLESELDFGPNFPVDRTFPDGEMESVHGKRPKGVLGEGKGA